MDERTEKLLIGPELNTAVAKTEYGKTLKKMMAGDEGLLEELSSKLKVARITADDITAERLIIGRVCRNVSGDHQSEETDDETFAEDEKQRLWCSLKVKNTADKNPPYTSEISRLKRNALGWVQEGSKPVPIREILLQHGLLDPRLGLAYWYKQGRDEKGREIVAYKDAGVKRGEVIQSYRHFLIRLWAYRLPDAKLSEQGQPTAERRISNKKRKPFSNGDPIAHTTLESKSRKTSALHRPISAQNNPLRDETFQGGAAEDEPVENELVNHAGQQLRQQFGWHTYKEWWLAYDRRDPKLTLEHLDNETICRHIGNGFALRDTSEDQKGLQPAPAPPPMLLRQAWKECMDETKAFCRHARCFRNWLYCEATGADPKTLGEWVPRPLRSGTEKTSSKSVAPTTNANQSSAQRIDAETTASKSVAPTTATHQPSTPTLAQPLKNQGTEVDMGPSLRWWAEEIGRRRMASAPSDRED